MRGKRAKQYRKLMQQYAMHFGFREPYQTLFDAEILEVAAKSKMNFMSLLKNTLHGEVKPMITQCCMRHLYNAQPKNEMIIEHAKHFERRRCNHHTLERPLSARECIASVIDPKGNQTNKHRYVVACQDLDLQQHLQTIPGVPIIYIVRSVMIMKPMSHATARITAKEEQSKLSAGIRKAHQISQPPTMTVAPGEVSDGDEDEDDAAELNQTASGSDTVAVATNGDLPVEGITDAQPKRKRRKGPKGPNPLSMKKAKLATSAPVSMDGKSRNRRKR